MKINKIKIYSINDYLIARNDKFNRLKMLNKKKISYLNHYIWWFSHNREIYTYEPSKNKFIYFWQKNLKSEKKNFYIGGWHSNDKNINLYDVLFALKWLLKKNKRCKKNYNWIAVVRRTNKSILKLTKYLGYVEIKDKKDLFYNLIKKSLSKNYKDYYFLKHILEK